MPNRIENIRHQNKVLSWFQKKEKRISELVAHRDRLVRLEAHEPPYEHSLRWVKQK